MATQLGCSILPGGNTPDSMSRMEAAVIAAHVHAGCKVEENPNGKRAFIGSITFLAEEVLNQSSGRMLEQEATRYL